ncbi:MAG TPA: hypothetical protein PLX89_25895 [Verrucomicrobiota bacterium]|nr:hypothetical protein [Verrucomicrobiota bacterium]
MQLPLAKLVLIVSAFAGVIAQGDSTNLPPALSSNLVQRVVLDPLQVTRIPVATDRLTTIRFPGPMTDLASALVATEAHPAAKFLLSFQPGESFFSIRALASGASTTLNVVWKSQTYVLELIESRNPWLSVIMTQPELPKAPRELHSPPPLQPRPWARFLEGAKAYESLKRKYPRAMPEVSVWNLGNERSFGAYSLRNDQLFYFAAEGVLVLRVTIASHTTTPLQFGLNPFSIAIGRQTMPVLLTDFEGLLPGGAESVAFVVFRAAPPAKGRTNPLADPIHVTLNTPTFPSGAPVFPLGPPEPSSVQRNASQVKPTVVVSPTAPGRGFNVKPVR